MMQYTMKQMCEHIVKSDLLVKGNGQKPTPEEIYNYSPTGELANIFEWFISASLKLGEFPDGSKKLEKPEKPLLGDLSIDLETKITEWYDGTNWRT